MHRFVKNQSLQRSLGIYKLKQIRTKQATGNFEINGYGFNYLLTTLRVKVRAIHRLVGLVVKASASRAEDPGFESCLRGDFLRGRVIPET